MSFNWGKKGVFTPLHPHLLTNFTGIPRTLVVPLLLELFKYLIYFICYDKRQYFYKL